MQLWDTFDEYVYPGENALWDSNTSAVHGLCGSNILGVEAFQSLAGLISSAG